MSTGGSIVVKFWGQVVCEWKNDYELEVLERVEFRCQNSKNALCPTLLSEHMHAKLKKYRVTETMYCAGTTCARLEELLQSKLY